MRSEPFVSAENLHGKTGRWLETLAACAVPRPHLRVIADECALLAIDMLRYFAHPEGRVFLPSTAAIVPGIRSLLDRWRSLGGTVVFTRHCHEGPGDLGMLGRFFDDYIRCGERDSEIIDDLAPLPSEMVFRKNTYDAFHATGLDRYLRERGMKQVLVTGVLTQMCCETTARSAFVRGYEVFVPVDALTTSSEELHVGSLRSMATCCAVMTSTEKLLNET